MRLLAPRRHISWKAQVNLNSGVPNNQEGCPEGAVYLWEAINPFTQSLESEQRIRLPQLVLDDPNLSRSLVHRHDHPLNAPVEFRYFVDLGEFHGKTLGERKFRFRVAVYEEIGLETWPLPENIHRKYGSWN